MSSNLVFQRAADTAWRTIAGETIVVHLSAKEFFGLNETAADFWHAMDGKADLEVLSARFGIAPGDAATFCAELQELGLADVVDNGEASSEDLPTSDGELAGDPRAEVVESPRIMWREEIRQVAASCAFSPGMNPLCTQVPFS